MRLVILLLATMFSSWMWAQDCKQSIVGDVKFWSCEQKGGLFERAEQGNKTAQYELGMAYLHGKDAPKDADQAFYWLSQSADQGVAASRYQLGKMYADGIGVDQDINQAIAAWLTAALEGYALAQFDLGNSYADGVGLQKDLSQAYVWYSLAASGGALPEANVRRDAIKASLTEEELATADEMRATLFQQILMSRLAR